jgi:phosphoglycolate phosphatase
MQSSKMLNHNHRFSNVRALIFDLDGTLIDSKVDLANSVNAMLQNMGRAPLPAETIYGYVGHVAAVFVRRAIGEAATDAEAEAALAFFLAYYRQHMLDNTVTYPGVREGLAQLKHHRMAVLTNKPVRISDAILEGLGLAHYFDFVYGGNSFETKKPDPLGANILLRDWKAAANEAMLVGDSSVDVRTARNAGIWACGVSYGIDPDGLRAHPPDLMLDSLTELPHHLNGKT